MKSKRSPTMKSIAKAVVVTSLAAASASALAANTSVDESILRDNIAQAARNNGSPFPVVPPENDTGMPDNGQSYADQHNARAARSDGSSFPVKRHQELTPDDIWN